jgi:hypothetical protein
MSKTFTDENLLVWEAYPSGGDFGFSRHPYIVFNCLSNRMLRPRVIERGANEAEAERVVSTASQRDLLELFRQSREIG